MKLRYCTYILMGLCMLALVAQSGLSAKKCAGTCLENVRESQGAARDGTRDWTIVIFGVTGDLAKRHLIPALSAILKRQQENIIIIGVGRKQETADSVLKNARDFIHDYDEKAWEALRSRTSYYQINFEREEDFSKLAEFIKAREAHHGLSGNRLVYLSMPSDLFCPLTQQLTGAKILEAHNSCHRIAYEKPFGSDCASARAINQCVEQLLDAQQIYRIDHYLAKEFVNSLVFMRTHNALLEPAWNSCSIDHVTLFLNEHIGIEGRGSFYDAYGALRDVVQNHLLQMVALVAMECPQDSLVDLSTRKTDVLKHITVRRGILGQYEGYRDEPGVAKESITETFAALELTVNTKRWLGVPFYVQSGKMLDKKSSEIQIVFKQYANAPANVFTLTASSGQTPNGGFSLSLNTKKPGVGAEPVQAKLEYCSECSAKEAPSAYEIIFQKIMMADRSISVSAAEIEYQWNIIDKVKSMSWPLCTYAKHSQGPQAAACFMTACYKH